MTDQRASLWVCGECFCLFGGTIPNRQLCQCASEEEHRALSEECHRISGTYWHFEAELCRCCAAELVDTRTKYARWFCAKCLIFAHHVNRTFASCVIPIGWHSIVNGVFINARSCSTGTGAVGAVDQLTAFFRESESVWEWGLEVTEYQWNRAGLPLGDTVAVDMYLQAVQVTATPKADYFVELLKARGIPYDWRNHAPFSLEPIWTEDPSQNDSAVDIVPAVIHPPEHSPDSWGEQRDANSADLVAPETRRSAARRSEPVLDASHAARDRIAWVYPDGRAEYTDLHLRAVSTRGGEWSWTVSVNHEVAGTADPVLQSGTAANLEDAKDACERAAMNQISLQERQVGRYLEAGRRRR
jgi:hypothetical protein